MTSTTSSREDPAPAFVHPLQQLPEHPAIRKSLASIPHLGSGMGWRTELKLEMVAHRDQIDFVEALADKYVHNPASWDELAAACEHFTVIPHGVSLSIGSARLPDRHYLLRIKSISDRTRSPYYSEHLCMTRTPGIDIGHLSPLWYTESVLQRLIHNVQFVQEFLEKPLVLENVTYDVAIPGNSMSQTEFFHRLVDSTGCGILLDVTNVYINATNHHFDPVEFLQQMPLDAVVQAHIAGGYFREGHLVDGHSQPVQDESWRLLDALAARSSVRGVILEHDTDFPAFPVLLDQVKRARMALSATD